MCLYCNRMLDLLYLHYAISTQLPFPVCRINWIYLLWLSIKSIFLKGFMIKKNVWLGICMYRYYFSPSSALTVLITRLVSFWPRKQKYCDWISLIWIRLLTVDSSPSSIQNYSHTSVTIRCVRLHSWVPYSSLE